MFAVLNQRLLYRSQFLFYNTLYSLLHSNSDAR